MMKAAKNGLKVGVMLMVVFTLSSCAYFKRKECEGMNWFTHGENLAKEGGTIEGDHTVRECRKVEANIQESQLDLGYKKGRSDYCKPEFVFDIGKKGQKFRDFMCDGENMKLLKKKYADGINVYCEESNGYKAGASGHAYQGVCPKDQEPKFLAKYNKGRIKYLNAQIDASEAKIGDIDHQITDIERKKQNLILKLAMTPEKQRVVRETRYDAARGREVEEVRTEADPASTSARNEIKEDIESADRQIAAKRSEQSALKAEIQKLKAEIRSLESED